MSSITAQEWELLGCFGVEPQLLDPAVPWCYNDAAYVFELDDLSVTFAIHPAYRDVRLIVRRGCQRLYELNAAGVTDVLVLDEPGRDIVEIRLSDREWLRVQVRPAFEIAQGFESPA